MKRATESESLAMLGDEEEQQGGFKEKGIIFAWQFGGRDKRRVGRTAEWRTRGGEGTQAGSVSRLGSSHNQLLSCA